MYKLLHFWLFLIQFLSHVFTGPTEGKATNTNIANGRWMGPSLMEWWCFAVQWFVRQPRARNLEPLPITWTHRAFNRLLGNVQPLLRRPGLQSNYKVPVINTRIVSVTTSLNKNVNVNVNVIRLDVLINEL